jgi:hypothetical protein
LRYAARTLPKRTLFTLLAARFIPARRPAKTDSKVSLRSE